MESTPLHNIPINTSTTTVSMVFFSNSVKLTSLNYFGWRKQIEAILKGLGLYKYIDGSYPALPVTITTNGVATPNTAYDLWYRQDQLLFGALVGTLSQEVISLITTIQTSFEA